MNCRVTAKPEKYRRLPRPWNWLPLLAALVLGCDPPGRPNPSDEVEPPRKELSFDALFQQNCAGCHGAQGKLGPAPPLNDEMFLSLISNAQLAQIIADGRPGTLMPAFAAANGGSLTGEQVKILADGIKPRWGTAARTAAQLPPLFPASTRHDEAPAGTTTLGLKAFARACAGCHGAQGKGGRFADMDDGDPVGAINDPAFLALTSDQALRRYVITGRPDLGMPGYADDWGRPAGFKPLTTQEITAVVSLLAAWRQQNTSGPQGN